MCYFSVVNTPSAKFPFPGTWGLDGTASSTQDIYDASANTWTVDQLSSPRAPRGATVDNKVVFAGGGGL